MDFTSRSKHALPDWLVARYLDLALLLIVPILSLLASLPAKESAKVNGWFFWLGGRTEMACI